MMQESSKISGRILVVGVGGLGVPAAVLLARAGVAHVGLIDPDPVDLSNLHRQVIYRESRLGQPKAEAAARYFRNITPNSDFEPFVDALNESNARGLIGRFDFVIDATDSPAAKFLINDVCIESGRPFSYGGVLATSGQAMTVIPRRTACLRCLFEHPPDAEEAATCREAGILGPVAAVIGAIQAREAIAVLCGDPPELAGKIFSYDAADIPRTRVRSINPRAGCICGAKQRAEQSVISPGGELKQEQT